VEIFIAYTKDSLIKDLTNTLEAWDKIPNAEPIAIEVPAKKYEIIRRVTAENMAKGNYILCDLGCVPNQEDVVERAEKMLQDEKIGMLKCKPGGGIRICRKGIVEKWPTYVGGSYDDEHGSAYRLEGYLVSVCPTLAYRRLNVH